MSFVYYSLILSHLEPQIRIQHTRTVAHQERSWRYSDESGRNDMLRGFMSRWFGKLWMIFIDYYTQQIKYLYNMYIENNNLLQRWRWRSITRSLEFQICDSFVQTTQRLKNSIALLIEKIYISTAAWWSGRQRLCWRRRGVSFSISEKISCGLRWWRLKSSSERFWSSHVTWFTTLFVCTE